MIPAMRTCFGRRALVAGAAVLWLLAGPRTADAKSYSADTFDAVIRILEDGALDVTETITFRFEDGTFTEVFREIPTRRTDGIEIVRAAVQGVTLPFGTERGTAEVRRRSNGVRVVWRFGPVEHTTREFMLTYRVRGAVRRTLATDELAWRATPGQHDYAIRSATIQFIAPVPPSAEPVVSARKAGTPRVSTEGREVRVVASGIGRNGWIEAALRFPAGVVIAAAPAWQQHAAEVAAASTMWMTIALAVFLAGFVLLLAWRQSYDRPPGAERWPGSQSPLQPDDLPPAAAGVLAANGSVRLEHAMAVLFSLADRGEVEIREARRTLGRREFQLRRSNASAAMTEWERTLLDIVFKDASGAGSTVPLSQARSRLARHLRRFGAAVKDALRVSGFLDENRHALRRRYQKAAIGLLIAGVAGFVAAAALSGEYGGWPILVPAAILALALVSLIFAGTITPLSNEGVRRSRRWRDYRDHLRAVSHGAQSGAGLTPTAILPFAVALGLANAWAKLLRHQRHAAPAWFHAAADDGAAFPAFIAAGGVGAGGGAHGGVSGAAGGGASGAH